MPLEMAVHDGGHSRQIARLPDMGRRAVSVESDVGSVLIVRIDHRAGEVHLGTACSSELRQRIGTRRSRKDMAVLEADNSEIVILRGNANGAYRNTYDEWRLAHGNVRDSLVRGAVEMVRAEVNGIRRSWP